MKEKLLYRRASIFEKGYPEVAIGNGVDFDELIEGDDDPMFMTLPIGEVNARSRNGRTYPRREVQGIVNAINRETVLGRVDHKWHFEMPSLTWIGAFIDEDGIAWGKAYIHKTAVEVREYIRVAKSANAKVATSLEGYAEVDEEGMVSDLELHYIDIVHPKQMGIPAASGVPMVTTESFSEDDQDIQEEEDPMPVKNKTEEPVTESEFQLRLAEINRKHKEALDALNLKVKEQEYALQDLNAVAERLQVTEGESPVVALQALIAERDNLQRENGELLQESIRVMVADKVAVEEVRDVIIGMVKETKPSRRSDVVAAIDRVLEQSAVKKLLQFSLAKEMGPAHTQPAQKPATDDKPQAEPDIIIPELEEV